MSHGVTPRPHRRTRRSPETALDLLWGAGALLLLLPVLPLVAVLWVLAWLRSEPAESVAPSEPEREPERE